MPAPSLDPAREQQRQLVDQRVQVAEVRPQRGVQAASGERPGDQVLDVEGQADHAGLVVEVEQVPLRHLPQRLPGDLQRLGRNAPDGLLGHAAAGGEDAVQGVQVGRRQRDVEHPGDGLRQAPGSPPHRRPLRLGLGRDGGRELVAGTDPLGGDRQVQQQVVEGVLVHLQAGLGQPAHRQVVQPPHPGALPRAAVPGQIVTDRLPRVQQQVADEPPLLPLGPLDPHQVPFPPDHQLVLPQQFAGPSEIGLHGGGADAELVAERTRPLRQRAPPGSGR
jgi:hypothetical protein